MNIRAATVKDAEAICEIYNYFVLKTYITFEEEPVSTDEMRKRIIDTMLTYPWLVAEQDGSLLGYAYATQWRTRSAYKYSVESTIYLSKSAAGKGIGTTLYGELLSEIKRMGFHSVNAGIALPNAASIKLQEKFGFSQVAHFKEIGLKFDQWLDVAYWQLNFD